MRRKADKGLTAAGKRKGRRPHYLSEQQLADPAANGGARVNAGRANFGWRAPYVGLSDTLLIVKVDGARRALTNPTQYDVAYLVLRSLGLGDEAEPTKVDAMVARIQRLYGDDANRVPGYKARPTD